MVTGEVQEAGRPAVPAAGSRVHQRVPMCCGSRTTSATKAIDAEMELLYHCNFGPPFLDDGAALEVAVRESHPRRVRSRASLRSDLSRSDRRLRRAGLQYDLLAREDGQTLAMLRNAAADKGLVCASTRGNCRPSLSGRTRPRSQTATSPGWSRRPTIPMARPLSAHKGGWLPMGPGESRRSELAIEVLDEASRGRRPGRDRSIAARGGAAYTQRPDCESRIWDSERC